MMTSQKNIFLLIADIHGHYIGSHGCNSVQTPNLDRLRAQGTTLEMAFAAMPSCSDWRTVTYTRLHTDENGQCGLQIMGKPHFQTFDLVDSGPKLFDQVGKYA
jgi:N-sulfoglucosamine sulfohydrolase